MYRRKRPNIANEQPVLHRPSEHPNQRRRPQTMLLTSTFSAQTGTTFAAASGCGFRGTGSA
jgi:hypothetical protein